MRLRVGSDEFMLYYCSADDDPFGGDVVIELPAREFAEYKKVEALHAAWQRKLHELWLREQSRTMNG